MIGKSVKENKMIKLINILKEIGENSYPFKDTDQTYDESDDTLLAVDYTFNTSTSPYKVTFYSGEYKPEDKTFDLSFGVDKGNMYKLDTFQMTGEGNAIKILSTVVEIIKDFLYQYDNEGAEKIVINPTSEKRRKIYQMLISKLPFDILSRIEIK
jgi:hypothetical protein